MAEDIDVVYRDYNTPGVPSSGDYDPEKPRIRKLLKEIAGGTSAVGDYRGSWSNATTYVASDIVQYGGSLWYAKVDNTNVTPVEGVTWTLFLPGATVADGSVTLLKLAPDVIAAINSSVADIPALRNLSTTGSSTAQVRDLNRGGTFQRDASDLSSKLVNRTITSTAVNSSTDTITLVAHGLNTGEGVFVTASVDGLTANTVYYAIRLTADTFKLATTFANARAGTAIDLTGTTNLTVKRLTDPRQGIYVISTGQALDGSQGAWVRQYFGLANVRWFGATGDGVTDDTGALTAATDLIRGVWISDGTYVITSSWELPNFANLHFESYNSIIRGDLNVSLICSKTRLTDRAFWIEIHGGRIDGVDRSGGSIAIDFCNVTYGRVNGTWMYNCQIGTVMGGNYGGGAQSSYYNVFHEFIISSCSIGVRCGTLGNSNVFSSGSIKDCVVGTEDDDNTDNTYDKVQIETFTAFGSRMSNSGVATVMIRVINCRFENPSTGGAYASAIGVRDNPAAQESRIRDNYISTVATHTAISGSGSQASGNT